MKRVMAMTGALALGAACSNAPSRAAAAGNELTSAPAKSAAEAPAAKPADASLAPVPTSGTAPASTPAGAPDGVPGAKYREVTLPAGTVLPVDLETAVGSDISRVEQPVSGRLRRAVTVGGVEVLPAGTAVSGHVTAAQRPGKVKGRGLIALRFTRVDTPGEGTSQMSTAQISRMAPATKEKDALKIVAPAAAGAVIGRIAGGKDAAAKGAVIGGAAGTGYVLSTRGKEIRLGKGADLSVKLTAPLTVRVPVRN
jgi:hypothetical protein